MSDELFPRQDEILQAMVDAALEKARPAEQEEATLEEFVETALKTVEPKPCSKCGKPSTGRGRAYCGPCAKLWRQQLATIKREIGDVEALKAQIGGACELCGLVTDLVIDHDHRSGVFRGLLCRPCNVGLGMFRDNPRLLTEAATYLLERLD